MRWLLLALALTGCVARHAVKPESLAQLDGYDVLATGSNEKLVQGVAYHRGRVLELRLKPDARKEGGEFLNVRLDGDLLRGELADGRHIAVSLRDVESASIVEGREASPIVPTIIGAVIVFSVWSLEIFLATR